MYEITEDVARHIIRLLPHRTDKEISKKLNVSTIIVKGIREGKKWKQLPRKKVITDEQVNLMIQLRKQGLSFEKIGRQLNISGTSVMRYLRKEKLKVLKHQSTLEVNARGEKVLPTFKDKGWLKNDPDGNLQLTELGLHIFAKSVVIDKITYEDAARYLRADIRDIKNQLRMLGVSKTTLSILIKSTEELQAKYPNAAL